jgi:hypothetical protein
MLTPYAGTSRIRFDGCDLSAEDPRTPVTRKIVVLGRGAERRGSSWRRRKRG